VTWESAAGKRVLITGATDGIGLAACEALARLGAQLTIVARSESKADRAVERITSAGGPGTTVDVLMADLASQAAVRHLADEVLTRYPRLDVLVNNAGAVFAKRQLSPDGIEMTWALNHLAPFLLTTLLLPRLEASGPARIITTSSAAHKNAHIPFDDLDSEHSYRPFGPYGETKLANILFTFELARRLVDTDVTATCFHPGVVGTGFNRNNGRLMGLAMRVITPFMRSPAEGADTLVWLVDSPEVEGMSGLYFVDRKVVAPSPAALDAETARRLWETSEAQTRLASPR
jgi:NAD(P)-dependent dehydrogenase (short-subunit alcohol dehydrogenase family)